MHVGELAVLYPAELPPELFLLMFVDVITDELLQLGRPDIDMPITSLFLQLEPPVLDQLIGPDIHIALCQQILLKGQLLLAPVADPDDTDEAVGDCVVLG